MWIQYSKFSFRVPGYQGTLGTLCGPSHLSGGDFYMALRPFFRWSQIRKKSKRKNEKTMVGFGRTEKSLSLSCTEFRALSHGHGFRGPCFQGVRKSWVFHDFWTVLFDHFFLTFV